MRAIDQARQDFAQDQFGDFEAVRVPQQQHPLMVRDDLAVVDRQDIDTPGVDVREPGVIDYLSNPRRDHGSPLARSA